MTPVLQAEAIARYRRDGVLFPIPVLNQETVGQCRAAVEDLERRLGGKPPSSSMSQPQLHFRWAYDLATHPAVLDVVEEILGPNILVHSASIFSKHAHTPDFVSWHQDGHYWGLDAPRLVSAWIALTDSTIANGCMRVVAGSQASCKLPHTDSPLAAGDNMLTSGLEVAVEVEENEALDVVLRAGEMSLHHVDIIHGSKPNRSNEDRIGFAVRYVAPEVRQTLRHHAVLLARGRDTCGHYELVWEPPSNSVETGLAALSEFSRKRLEKRFGATADRSDPG